MFSQTFCCCACIFLLCPVQTEDLARMYRLFSRISKGLDPIADCFKEHVESEGMKLVKQVAEAAEAKKEKDAGGDRCAFPGALWGPLVEQVAEANTEKDSCV